MLDVAMIQEAARLTSEARLREALSHLRTPEMAEAPRRSAFTKAAFRDGDETRDYMLYVPARATGRRALIVMLHGCGQSAQDFARGTRMNTLADEHGFLVLYPEQSARANRSRCWNWFEPSDQRRGEGEPAFIAALTRHVIEEHDIDPRRVYVAGLSAGGAAAAVLGEAYPELFAAVGVHSGLACGAASDVASALHAMRHGAGRRLRRLQTGRLGPRPMIVFHGGADHTVTALNGEDLISQSDPDAALTKSVEAGQSRDGRAFTRALYRDARGRTRLEHWFAPGLGHAWSGGDPAGSNVEARGPDASAEMARFFFEHTRP